MSRLRSLRVANREANLIAVCSNPSDLRRAAESETEVEEKLGVAILESSPHAVDPNTKTLQTADDRLLNYHELIFA